MRALGCGRAVPCERVGFCGDFRADIGAVKLELYTDNTNVVRCSSREHNRSASNSNAILRSSNRNCRAGAGTDIDELGNRRNAVIIQNEEHVVARRRDIWT